MIWRISVFWQYASVQQDCTYLHKQINNNNKNTTLLLDWIVFSFVENYTMHQAAQSQLAMIPKIFVTEPPRFFYYITTSNQRCMRKSSLFSFPLSLLYLHLLLWILSYSFPNSFIWITCYHSMPHILATVSWVSQRVKETGYM
jgi:hypothetical protein